MDNLNEIIAAMEAAYDRLYSKVGRECDAHFDRVIFTPEFPGDDPLDQWERRGGRDDFLVLHQLRDAIN